MFHSSNLIFEHAELYGLGRLINKSKVGINQMEGRSYWNMTKTTLNVV